MKTSAGLVLYREAHDLLEILLVHPGGPIWASRDLGAWSIPKGEVPEGEELLDAAKREFKEELGTTPEGLFLPLGSVTQKGGKVVHAWAVRCDLDISRIESNTFTMEWPPHSGRQQEFPEVDRAAFFRIEEAKKKINPAQIFFLDKLQKIVR
jgi:predicted NUDIX family NTP pyrophosphohydrolase